MDFLYQIGGVSKAPGNLTVKFCNEHSQLQFTPEQPRVTSKLKLAKCLFGEDFSFLRSVTKATPKVTIPSPSMMHYRGGRAAIDPAVYPDMEEFWEDLAEVYACELDALATLGCAYLQLDDTSLAYLNDPAQRKYVDEIGGDGELQHNTYIKLINAALKRKPDGMAVYIHLCRGNYRSSWAATGGYDYVADALFNELNVDGYFLEYDDYAPALSSPCDSCREATRPSCSVSSRASEANSSARMISSGASTRQRSSYRLSSSR